MSDEKKNGTAPDVVVMNSMHDPTAKICVCSQCLKQAASKGDMLRLEGMLLKAGVALAHQAAWFEYLQEVGASVEITIGERTVYDADDNVIGHTMPFTFRTHAKIVADEINAWMEKKNTEFQSQKVSEEEQAKIAELLKEHFQERGSDTPGATSGKVN